MIVFTSLDYHCISWWLSLYCIISNKEFPSFMDFVLSGGCPCKTILTSIIFVAAKSRIIFRKISLGRHQLCIMKLTANPITTFITGQDEIGVPGSHSARSNRGTVRDERRRENGWERRGREARGGRKAGGEGRRRGFTRQELEARGKDWKHEART